MLKELIKVANKLDSLRLTKEADRLDAIIRKVGSEEVKPIDKESDEELAYTKSAVMDHSDVMKNISQKVLDALNYIQPIYQKRHRAGMFREEKEDLELIWHKLKAIKNLATDKMFEYRENADNWERDNGPYGDQSEESEESPRRSIYGDFDDYAAHQQEMRDELLKD